MNPRLALVALLAGAGLAGSALAQDSVSRNADGGNGLPGDALNPWALDQQCASYRVGFSTFESSTGNLYRIAPVFKGSRTQNGFFSSLFSAHAMSKDMRTGVPYASGSYASWSAPGFGVNPDPNINFAGQQVSPSGLSNQLAIGVTEFGGTATLVSGAILNFNPNDNDNVYVKRVVGAVNTQTQQGGDYATFGFGQVDADGNLCFRADNNLVTGLPVGDRIQGNNIFRVDMAARDCGALNFINNNGPTDAAATVWAVQRDASTSYNVPSIIPASWAGRPIFVGPSFDVRYRYESAPGVVSATQAHLVVPDASGGDHRGAIGASQRAIFRAGSVATLGVLQRQDDSFTDTIGVWGVDANGAVVGAPKALVHPISVADPRDPYVSVPAGPDVFTHFRSQTAFRGGSGQVAVGADQNGNVLAAATTSEFGSQADPFNNIAVARFPAANPAAAPQWTLAAWIDFIPNAWPEGKPIRDAAGNVIGELTGLFQVTNNNPPGPSIGGPAFDSVGNVYFLAAVQIYNGADDDTLPFVGGTPRPANGDDTYTNALVRAVYDPATFGYSLELIATNRQVFTSADTGLQYQIQFIEIADNDSVASGAFWSHNTTEAALNGQSVAGLSPSDSRTLGGLILSADICYDVDGDGDFNDPTSPFEPGSADESYNVLLFISGTAPSAPACPGDLTGDGFVNSADLAALLGAWGPGSGPADLTGDGFVNSADLAAMLGAWGSCPQ